MINTLNNLLVQQGLAVIYLDDGQNVIAANEKGDEILERKDGIFSRNGRLAFYDKDAQESFDKLKASTQVSANTAIFVRRQSSEPPYRLSYVEYVDEWKQPDLPRPQYLLLVSDPTKSFDFPDWVFKEYYGLTSAELRLASAIFRDKSLHEQAEDRGIKISTVRWTLDNIFSKTFTNSQRAVKGLAMQFAV